MASRVQKSELSLGQHISIPGHKYTRRRAAAAAASGRLARMQAPSRPRRTLIRGVRRGGGGGHPLARGAPSPYSLKTDTQRAGSQRRQRSPCKGERREWELRLRGMQIRGASLSRKERARGWRAVVSSSRSLVLLPPSGASAGERTTAEGASLM